MNCRRFVTTRSGFAALVRLAAEAEAHRFEHIEIGIGATG